MPNRLQHESSPYLLQHQNNPVDWYPWGDEAIRAAQEQNKPIFLSIGYAACHWCHVMEHESFEDETIAALLNDKFICVKVDREERPDLDQIYMTAVQILTGHGGWPMSVFLTPQLKPFFGGTYWPPQRRMNMPGFQDVILAVEDAWEQRREKVLEQSEELTRHIQNSGSGASSAESLPQDFLRSAAVKMEQAFDFTHGGFGTAPKFPHSMGLQFFMRVYQREPQEGLLNMVRLNLDKMAAGGIYDHLAGGFARYSVDAKWLVPHFEKMLYDNALLTDAYLDGFLLLKDPHYAQVATETIDYVLQYMTDEQGGFHSTEDADSEGVEGKFYVWTPAQIEAVLGAERGERFCYVYDVTPGGNFEGNSILNLPKTLEQCASLRDWDLAELQAELATSRQQLLAARDQRVRPGKDDKVLVSWNALMIHSMARGAAILQRSDWLDAACRAANFIRTEMRRDDGRLLHCWRLGEAKLDAYLDDYAYLIHALVSLYEASFDETWIDWAVELAEIVQDHFSDAGGGGFFFTADDHEQLIARNKDMQDASVPSGNAMAATALIRLGKLTGAQACLEAAEGAILAAVDMMQQAPNAMSQMLVACDMLLGPFQEIAILGGNTPTDTAAIIDRRWQTFLPRSVVARRNPASNTTDSKHLSGLFAGKQPADEVQVFVCENFSCQQPVQGREAADALWESLAAPPATD